MQHVVPRENVENRMDSKLNKTKQSLNKLTQQDYS